MTRAALVFCARFRHLDTSSCHILMWFNQVECLRWILVQWIETISLTILRVLDFDGCLNSSPWVEPAFKWVSLNHLAHLFMFLLLWILFLHKSASKISDSFPHRLSIRLTYFCFAKKMPKLWAWMYHKQVENWEQFGNKTSDLHWWLTMQFRVLRYKDWNCCKFLWPWSIGLLVVLVVTLTIF